MRSKNRILLFISVLFVFFPFLFTGCSGFSTGGGGDDSAPIIGVAPADYDFGDVTPGNSSEPLEVVIKNEGSAKLTINDIYLTEEINFDLDLEGGSDPCYTASSGLPAGEQCTVEVLFNPATEKEAVFSADLEIASNDPDKGTERVSLTGIQVPVEDLSVRINDFECGVSTAQVYVSVIDQLGFPVAELVENNFLVTEAYETGAESSLPIISVSYQGEGESSPISAALVMGYSGSITESRGSVEDMEDAVKVFIDQMEEDDEAEIIKFANEARVYQEFTSDKNDLKNAVDAAWEYGDKTALYDAVGLGVIDTADFGVNDRKAVIVITDGNDDSSVNYDKNGVIRIAQNEDIPLFTIANGVLSEFYTWPLENMAEQTGGEFYEALEPEDLRIIYRTVAGFLDRQYILEYDTDLSIVERTLRIEASWEGFDANSDPVGDITGIDEKAVTCE